jgi:hypothetical protein
MSHRVTFRRASMSNRVNSCDDHSLLLLDILRTFSTGLHVQM